MKLELIVQEKTFTNESGDVIKYNVYYVEILGEKVYLKPDKADKKMLNFLINQVK